MGTLRGALKVGQNQCNPGRLPVSICEIRFRNDTTFLGQDPLSVGTSLDKSLCDERPDYDTIA